MNYFLSELFRLIRVKALFAITVFWVGGSIVMALAITRTTSTSAFKNTYYWSLVNVASLTAVFLVLLISSFLIGKDLSIIKQCLAFGVSRTTIYLTKFLVLLLFFLVGVSLLAISSFVVGQSHFSDSGPAFKLILSKLINLLPLFMSELALCHFLNFSRVNGIVVTMVVFLIYFMSADIMYLFEQLFSNAPLLTDYMPASLLEQGLNGNHFALPNVLIGVGSTLLFLLMGLSRFKRRDVQ